MNTDTFNKEWSELAATIEQLHAKHVRADAIRQDRLQWTEGQLLKTLYENMEELVNSIKEITKS